jgi:hypothetical protein
MKQILNSSSSVSDECAEQSAQFQACNEKSDPEVQRLCRGQAVDKLKDCKPFVYFTSMAILCGVGSIAAFFSIYILIKNLILMAVAKARSKT